MANEFSGKKVAFLVAQEGIEQVELTAPWDAVQQGGGTPVLLAPEEGTVQAFDHLDKADTFDVDVSVAKAPSRTTPRWCCPAAWPTPTRCARMRTPCPSCATS